MSAELGEVELSAVAAQMAGAGVDLAGPLTARLIAGGRSNLTFRLDDGVSSWVLRTPPRAGRTPSAHDVAREFRVTSALGATDVPVPPAVVLCEDESLIGGPFTVAGFVPGATVQTAAQLDALDDTVVSAVVSALSSTLAALHRVDHVAAGLERFGRPDGYAARQLKRWSGQWEIVGGAFDPAVRSAASALAAALGDRLPRQAATGIVHGDYRIDNTLLALPGGGPDSGSGVGSGAGGVSVAAVVDWELSTIGDPVADVAMMCVYRHPVFDQVIGEPTAWTSPRLPEAAGLAAAYEAAGGVDLVDLDEHLALGYLKLAVIAAGIDHRYRAGATSGSGFDTAGQAVPVLLEEGLAVLRG
ncbi:phosphotransferase family protein [uncultured Nocardioides sp.]|uniref:phosphotransferase family protein n=1 Tax=uncultured Nocardioides sp. TaxID=198441 RepID=UPI0026146F60|nr:phosphotransferase family protein [uncultured Nocardioides sp.]